MIAELQCVGIDVSKERLDVHLYPRGDAFNVANSSAGLTTLKARLKQLKIKAIGLEASGGYERRAANELAAAGFLVNVVDPAQVRSFARAMKTRAKTDAIDAAMIARYLAAAGDVLIAHQPDVARERLGVLAAYRRRLREECKALKSLLDTTAEPLVQRLISKRLAVIAGEIKHLEAQIRSQIAADPALAERASRLACLPGVGPVLTATLLAELKELGQISAKRIASLIGVAPHARQSGKTTRSGKCGGGRKAVRDVLYMATLSAIKARMPHLYPFYQRLRTAGKPFKIALIAAMRKFLTIINAIIRDNAQFNYKTT
jgi:transposase